jgi:carotenoid cleavage dioxygenase-like enzyme
MHLPIILHCLFITQAFGENVGWKKYFVENPTEFHDIPLSWNEDTPVPNWLSGTYVRNGAAQISFGSERRILTSWLDGFAKLHSFKFSGSQVLFSGKMLESPNYLASVAAGELQPMSTLNKFGTVEEEWTFWEKMIILNKTL